MKNPGEKRKQLMISLPSELLAKIKNEYENKSEYIKNLIIADRETRKDKVEMAEQIRIDIKNISNAIALLSKRICRKTNINASDIETLSIIKAMLEFTEKNL